ncbi:MAG: type II toxin-antitoxin system VapC family toxin [Methylococcaceae bacterium]
MIAIDTNIIVRFLTRDDEEQYKKAYQIFADSKQLFIPTTVILETEWVLRFSYKFPIERIVFALSGLLKLNNVNTENKSAVINALQWHQQGMDFADALHLASSLHTDKFLSFDKKFIKKAINIGINIIEP